MNRKIYKLFFRMNQWLFAFVLTAFSETAFTQTTYTFNYTGAIQTLTLPAGTYSAECWGAHGGWHNLDANALRGRGGYSRGTITLTATTVLYIAVGGAGGTQTSNSVPGGWNGGGNAKYYSYSFNGGGGASHVATATGVLSALASNTNAVLIVAGGGGGGASSATPGDGGGVNGGNSSRSGCTGGTQTSPGASSISGANASFGQGWDGTPTGGSYGAGGGGWYGGGCESGGSGYIGGVSNAGTYIFGQTGFIPNPNTSLNGLVRITELCSISLTAAGATNSLSPAICAGQNLTLTTDAVSNYSWSTGVTGTNQIIVSPTTNTVYSVSGTSSLSCNAARTISVSVSSSAPVLTISATSNSICLGDSIAITASGALSYTYSGGVTAGAYFSPTTTTSYSVTGENGCGVASAFTTVTVSPLSVFALSTPATVCALKPSTLTAAGAQSFTWMPSSIPSQTLVVAPPSTSIYTVLGQSGNCFGSTTVQVNTLPNPTITITASDMFICEGESVTMQLSGADSYTWQTPGLSGTSVTVTPNIPTAYDVIGTNSLGCTSGAQHVVIVYPQPTVAASASPSLICLGGTATLSASGANTYTWASDNVQASSTTVSPASNAVYSVTGTENTHGCSATTSVAVSVYVATISVSPNTSVCPGSSLMLTAGAASSYTWSDNLGSAKSVSVIPAAPTIYTVNATVSAGGQSCTASNTVQVDIFPQPTVTATSPRPSVCRNERVAFTATGAVTYKWSNGMNVQSFTLTATSTNPFIYSVTGTDVNGCKATDAITVSVSNCVGIEEQSAASVKLYPNPNSGVFTIELNERTNIVIINTAGQIVREMKDVNGTVKIEGLSRGVYVLRAGTGNTFSNTSFIVE